MRYLLQSGLFRFQNYIYARIISLVFINTHLHVPILTHTQIHTHTHKHGQHVSITHTLDISHVYIFILSLVTLHCQQSEQIVNCQFTCNVNKTTILHLCGRHIINPWVHASIRSGSNSAYIHWANN